jgi:hypothetical protein
MPSDTKLQLGWIHSVAGMRLQQAEQDPSPTKMDPMISLVERFGKPHRIVTILVLSNQH